MTIEIPPLRERTGEIAQLARRFLAEATEISDVTRAGDATGASARPFRLTRDAVARLERHDWPGNIRELKNVIERAVLLAPGDEVDVGNL